MKAIAYKKTLAALRSGSASTYCYVLYGVNVVLLVSTVVSMEWQRQGHESVTNRMEQYHLMTVTRAAAIKGEISIVEDALIARALEIRSPNAMANSEPFLTTYPGAGASLYLAESELAKINETQSVFRGFEFEELAPRTERQFSDLYVIISGGLYQRSEVETAQRQLTGLALSLEQLRRLHRSEHAGLAQVLPRQDRRRLQTYQHHRDEIDLVVLDLWMPRMSGQEVLANMRTLDPAVKVVVSTGYAEQPEKLMGTQATLLKPYRIEDALRTIRQVLDE